MNDDLKVKLTHVTPRADGTFEVNTKEVPLSSVVPTLKRIPEIWAHKHYSDETIYDFDSGMVDVCATCRERLTIAIDEGRRCAKHPLAYFEPATIGAADGPRPAYCEDCAGVL